MSASLMSYFSTNLCMLSSIGNWASAAFAELYVRGFLFGGSYEAIPLERNAYELAERYTGNRLRPFSVADEVARWIAEDRF